MIRRGTAAPTHDVDKTARRELSEHSGGVGRDLVITPGRIWQAGAGVATDAAIGNVCQPSDVWRKRAGAERAVDADAQRVHVSH